MLNCNLLRKQFFIIFILFCASGVVCAQNYSSEPLLFFQERRAEDYDFALSISKKVFTKLEEEKYPYYKYFIYSDYPTESFLKMKLINKERYPTIDFYLNEEERKKKHQIITKIFYVSIML